MATREQKLEIIDRVTAHLLKQGKRSEDLERSRSPMGCYVCLYRGPDGMKCAVGVLIADVYYDGRFDLDCLAADEPRVREALAQSLGMSVKDEIFAFAGLISRLQALHDDIAVVDWPEALTNLRAEVAAS